MKFLSLFLNNQYRILVAFQALNNAFFHNKNGDILQCFFSMKTFYYDVG